MSKPKIHIEPWFDPHHTRCRPNVYVEKFDHKRPPVALAEVCKNCHKSVMDEGWKFENGFYYYWGYLPWPVFMTTPSLTTTTMGFGNGTSNTWWGTSTTATLTYQKGWVKY